jgi:hypothetical protein
MRARSLLLIVAAAVSACGRDMDPPRPEAEGVSPATFAAVLAELSIARAELLPDTAAYRARIADVLARYQVTTEDLIAFVDGYGENEDVMLGSYSRAAARLDSMFGSGRFETEGSVTEPVTPPLDVPPAATPEATPSVIPDATPSVIPDSLRDSLR